jgi:hypothetical protein
VKPGATRKNKGKGKATIDDDDDDDDDDNDVMGAILLCCVAVFAWIAPLTPFVIRCN